MEPKKVIQLYTDQGFEVGAIELLAKYEPGPLYVLSTETPDGPGVYLCDVPFTLEEAEEQHNLVPPEALVDLDEVDDADDVSDDLDELVAGFDAEGDGDDD